MVQSRIAELERMKAWVRDHPSMVDPDTWPMAMDWINGEIAALKKKLPCANRRVSA